MKLTNTHLSIYLICRQTFVVNDPQSSLSQVLAHCSPSLYHPTPDLSGEMQKGWRPCIILKWLLGSISLLNLVKVSKEVLLTLFQSSGYNIGTCLLFFLYIQHGFCSGAE